MLAPILCPNLSSISLKTKGLRLFEGSGRAHKAEPGLRPVGGELVVVQTRISDRDGLPRC